MAFLHWYSNYRQELQRCILTAKFLKNNASTLCSKILQFLLLDGQMFWLICFFKYIGGVSGQNSQLEHHHRPNSSLLNKCWWFSHHLLCVVLFAHTDIDRKNKIYSENRTVQRCGMGALFLIQDRKSLIFHKFLWAGWIFLFFFNLYLLLFE